MDNAAADSTNAAGPGPLGFPVIAVGASAGGLPALASLLGGFSAPLDAALVVVTHTSPETKSRLAEILAARTPLPVTELSGDDPVRRGVVHVLPSGHDVLLEGGALRLVVRDDPPHRPIDRFMASLARELGPRSVGVILSGAGSDGSLGIRDIHDAGGLVIVQKPETASHAGMPESAMRTGWVDAVLAVEEIAPYLADNLPACRRGWVPGTDDSDTPERQAALERILTMLRERTGHDVSGYKRSTVLRRIHKRMLIGKTPDLVQYADFLARDPEECSRLFADLLIGVTAFFRDEPAFDLLSRAALPAILDGLGPGEVMRAWVACCSTGEEAYSLAMLVAECRQRRGDRRPAKIFATDVDSAALDVARKGVYSLRLTEPLGQERLASWFQCIGSRCTVMPGLREDIVFAVHDLLRDPPFLGMDLIVCRNFLIYLNPEVQGRVISFFSHALRPGGFLLLGPAETLGAAEEFFETVDKKWRLYRRKAAVPGGMSLPSRFVFAQRQDATVARPRPLFGPPDPDGLAESALLERYAPPAALLDLEGQVVRLIGDTRPYLELGAGAPSLTVRKLARKVLRPHLRDLLDAVLGDGAERSSPPILLDPAAGGDAVVLRGSAIPDSRGRPAYLLLVFEKTPVASPAALPEPERASAALVDRYELEIERLNDRLQRAVEGYEALTEELKASNEELVSMNEELQSSNEEMEASREELQSLNEELISLNAELQAKIEEAAAAQGFVENLLAATNLPTVVLDADLSVVRFTPAAVGLFHLIESDRGRPVAQIKTAFNAGHLLEDCRLVLRDGGIVEREFPAEDDRWFLERVYPFRGALGGVDGVVLTFADVTALKQAEAVLLRGKRELEQLVVRRTEELREKARLLDLANVMVRDLDGRITFWNAGAEQLFGWTTQEAVGRASFELLQTEFPEPLETIMGTLLRNGRWSGELRKRTKDGRIVDLAVLWVLNRDAASRPVSILEVGNDVTDRNRLEEQARRWSRVFEAAEFGLAHVSASDNTFLEVNASFARQRGYTPEELVGQPLSLLFPPDAWERVRTIIQEFDETGHGLIETEHLRKDGSRMPVLVEITVLRDAKGVPVSRVAYALDITERLKAEEAVRDMARFPGENPNPVLRVGTDMLVRHANAASAVFLTAYGSAEGLLFPESFQEVLGQVLRDGRIGHFEVRVEDREFVFAVCPVAGRDYVNVYGMDITERKRAELALIESEAKYHNLFESMGEGVCLLEMVRDASGAIDDYRILDVNTSYATILGVPREQAVGRLVRELFGLDEPPDLGRYSRVLETGRAETFETVFAAQQKYLRVSAFPIGPERFAAVFADVTQSVLAAEALAKSEARLRQLVDAAPDAIIIQSEGRFAYLNPAGVRLFGATSVHDLLGEDIVSHMHPNSREIVRERIRKANEERVSLPRLELEYLRLDGTVVPVEAVAVPFDYQGVPGSLVFTRDISERRREAEEKRHQTALLDAVDRMRGAYVAGQAPEIIFDAALTEVLLMSDSRYGYIAELHADERGRPYQQCLAISNVAWDEETRRFYEANAPGGFVFHAMDGLNAAAVVSGEPVIANAPTDDPRSSGRLPEGHPPLEAFVGLPLYHGRECVGSIGLANRAGGYDAALVDYLRPMLDACAQIIERLRAERRLVAAKQIAEAASLSKSEFLANMSHEIRTPLNGVLGMLQLLWGTSLDAEQTEYVEHAVKSSKRLTRLLSDILDLSLVESGRLAIRLGPCSTAELRAAVMDLFDMSAREKGLTLSVSLGAGLPETILADEVRVRQILFNLVGNAVKFTDRGGVRLDISPASLRFDAAFRVLVTVTDTGIGISDDQLGGVFEPFSQVEGVYMRRFGGAGLGLSIVRRLVGLMGGEIAVDSIEGAGTTMYVSLPLGRLAAMVPAKNDVPTDGRAPGKGLRVLLAEDDAVSLMSFSRMLLKAGHSVDTAVDGTKVLALLAERDYDCILMDVQMPVMDGVDATRTIRASSGLGAKARIPIIAMTAYAMAGDREKFLEAGMDDYVSKPVELDALEQALKRVAAARAGGGGQ